MRRCDIHYLDRLCIGHYEATQRSGPQGDLNGESVMRSVVEITSGLRYLSHLDRTLQNLSSNVVVRIFSTVGKRIDEGTSMLMRPTFSPTGRYIFHRTCKHSVYRELADEGTPPGDRARREEIQWRSLGCATSQNRDEATHESFCETART